MNSFKFNINNGDTQVWEQKEADGEVNIYRLLDDWEKTDEKPLCIPSSDMVMLANLYRYARLYDIADAFINPEGNERMTVDNIADAVAKQTTKRIIVETETDREFEDYICPICKDILQQQLRGAVRVTIYKYKHCPNCGQALDWSGEDEK